MFRFESRGRMLVVELLAMMSMSVSLFWKRTVLSDQPSWAFSPPSAYKPFASTTNRALQYFPPAMKFAQSIRIDSCRHSRTLSSSRPSTHLQATMERFAIATRSCWSTLSKNCKCSPSSMAARPKTSKQSTLSPRYTNGRSPLAAKRQSSEHCNLRLNLPMW